MIGLSNWINSTEKIYSMISFHQYFFCVFWDLSTVTIILWFKAPNVPGRPREKKRFRRKNRLLIEGFGGAHEFAMGDWQCRRVSTRMSASYGGLETFLWLFQRNSKQYQPVAISFEFSGSRLTSFMKIVVIKCSLNST